MKAVVIEAFGNVDQMNVREVPTPEPADNEVLLRVAYAGVNPVDWKIRVGMLKNRLPHLFPLVPGWDAAGTVAKCGRSVTRWNVNEELFAYCRKPIVQWGTYAEFVAVPEEFLSRKPGNLTFREAAAFPLASLTAWQSLFDILRIRRDETLLIHAGAGGVGGFAIQFAKRNGATVITTARKENHHYVSDLGADRIIDHSREDFVEAVRSRFPEGIDAVYDCVGGEIFDRSYRCLKRGGRIHTIAAQPKPQLDREFGVSGSYLFARPNGEQLAEIADLCEREELRAPAISEFPLEEARRAHEQIETARTQGKIVLRIA